MLATDMGAGEPQMMAQAIGERQAGFDLDLDGFPLTSNRTGMVVLTRDDLRRRGLERAFDHRAGSALR